MTQVNVSEARATLPEVLDRVERGEEITITRHGRPVAVLLRPDAVRARRTERVFQQARGLREMLEAARNEPLGEACIDPGYAEAWVAEIRADRDR